MHDTIDIDIHRQTVADVIRGHDPRACGVAATDNQSADRNEFCKALHACSWHSSIQGKVVRPRGKPKPLFSSCAKISGQGHERHVSRGTDGFGRLRSTTSTFANSIASPATREAWAATLDEAWLGADQTWFSGMAQRQLTMPRTMLLMHVFNHQTHHRGQAHAMLTAACEKTGDTDLMLVVPMSSA